MNIFFQWGKEDLICTQLESPSSDLLTVTSVLNPSRISNDRLFSYKARRHVLTTGTTRVSTSLLT